VARDDHIALEIEVTLSVQDRLDIQELIYRCNWSNDTGSGKEWSGCFLPEGVFDSLDGKIEGREALANFAEKVWSGSDPEWSAFRGSMHFVSNLVIDGQENQALARCYLVIFMSTHEREGKVILLGHYADRLQKIKGRWYFVERVLRYWPSEAVQAKIDGSKG
jgi:hypothetical protein